MKIISNKEWNELNDEILSLQYEIADYQERVRNKEQFIEELLIRIRMNIETITELRNKLKVANGKIGGMTKYINRLKDSDIK